MRNCAMIEKKLIGKKIEKLLPMLKRVFPNLFIEVFIVATIVATLSLSTGIIRTATLQEINYAENQSFQNGVNDPYFEILSGDPTIKTIEYQTSQMCFIGDSRTVHMQGAVLTNSHFITKSSMNLELFNKTVVEEFDEIKDDIELCIVALGVNDVNNVNGYIAALNEFADKHPDKVFVYVNVGPVDESKNKTIFNESLEVFNNKMENGLNQRWQIVDQYTYLTTEGFDSDDGLHYSFNDSVKIFTWIVDSVKTQSIIVENN